MARARNIKPGFFTDGELTDLEPLARLLFIGLWCLADKNGRLKDKPRDIKLQILPADNCDINSLLNQLANHFIIRYEIDGNKYIQIKNFYKHQNPHKNETDSDIPAYTEISGNIEKLPEEYCINRADSLNSDSLNSDSLNSDSLNSDKKKNPPFPSLAGGDAPCGAEEAKPLVKKQKPAPNKDVLRQDLYAAVEALTSSKKVQKAARDWIDVRLAREKKDWPTVRAVELALERLRKWEYSEEEAVECFEQSAINGWKGLFKLRGG